MKVSKSQAVIKQILKLLLGGVAAFYGAILIILTLIAAIAGGIIVPQLGQYQLAAVVAAALLLLYAVEKYLWPSEKSRPMLKRKSMKPTLIFMGVILGLGAIAFLAFGFYAAMHI